MYEYPQFDVNDEIHKQIKNAFTIVQRINATIEDRVTALTQQRREIETKLINESKDFVTELNEVKAEIEKFKEATSVK